MKLKALWTSKITPLQAVCLITNKNTHSTGAINVDQSGRFLGWGESRPDFYSTVKNVGMKSTRYSELAEALFSNESS